jgi:hypothetical protein
VIVAMLLYGVFTIARATIPFVVVIMAIPILAFLIYHRIREKIIIADILEGRNFSCNSILVLMEKEKAITETAVIFRQFLELMKTWNGREVTDIEPGIPPKLRLIEPPHAAE